MDIEFYHVFAGKTVWRFIVYKNGLIDEFLSLSVGSVKFTLLRERTEELLDYLSNGLPGKGMGMTSKAAKGFLTKRILTKSFLELNVDSPEVYVPQHETLSDSILLKLGKQHHRVFSVVIFAFAQNSPPQVMLR